MKAPAVDPRHLDVAAFASAGATADGAWPVAGFERLAESIVPEALKPGADVRWAVRGERLEPTGAPAEAWLELGVAAALPLVCQRCLAPVDTEIAFERRILFVAGADVAEQLDEEREEDVLALPKSLDLHTLVEDELLLGLPLVPRHVVCPAPLVNPAAGETEEDGTAQNPFGVLAALKRERPLN